MNKKKKFSKIQGARFLRKKPTTAERILWGYLNNRGVCATKFRRQHPMSGFILDFYCPEEKLAIEVDGKIHDNRKEYDVARQRIIESKGIKFLRFKNEEIFKSLDRVVGRITKELSPSPLCGEGCHDEKS